MKIIKYILCQTALCALLVSCQNDPAVVVAGEEGIPVEIYFRVNVSDRTAVSRSLAGLGIDENAIHDLNVFVFDQSSGDLDGSAFIASVETTPARIYVSGTTGLRKIVVIANAGSEITGVGSFADLEAIVRTLPSGTAFLNDGHTVMVGAMENVSVDPGGSPTPNIFDIGTLDVERLTAKVTVVIDKSGLDLGSYDLFIDVQQIQLRQVPSSYPYLGDNAPSTGLVDGDVITLIEGNLSPDSHDAATPLYMLENKQGTKTPSTSGVNYINDAGSDLGPRYTLPITMVPEGGDIGLCSYVEITASYHAYDLTPQGAEGADGEVIYKIFLGTGLSGSAWNNFDVNRNTWYKVTVFLNGKGGADEISWRIDTEITSYSPDDPDDSDRYAYTIDPEDSLYWTVADNNETLYKWSTNNANIHQMRGEYYEGRWATDKLHKNAGNIANFPAFYRCISMNNTLNSFSDLKYYLPAQNELQMLNIHRNASFTPGLYWSSTQLNEGTNNANHYARLIDYNNNGEAFTQDKDINAYVRCLRVPPHLEVNSAWDGRVYPYVDDASPYPLVVNRESRPDGSPRGLKAFALRTGAPYAFLTSNYHTVQLVYKAYRVARADCNPDGTPVEAGSTAPMDWYTAVGYLPATPSDVGYVPQVNPVRTGCNAYYEDGDVSQIGKWRLPTSLELQQMWIMGAGTKGTRPADPSLGGTLYGYDASGNIIDRLPGINDSFAGQGYIPLYGTIATLTANINAIGSNNPSYSLDNCYWSCTTTGNSDGSAFAQNRYAFKMDFFSGDGYAGRWNFHPKPDKTNPGLVRCVMDVVR